MSCPSTPEDWNMVARDFWRKWQFPQCLGSVDGKHVVMMKPWNSGSKYFNYKGTCSVILMALVDANLQFIAIDIGSAGRNSDGGVFARCAFGQRFITNSFNLPPAGVLPDFPQGGVLPYVAIGDEAFPLLQNLLRPYPGRQIAMDKQLFNYRLSRARRTVENAFGVLAARWRVFHSKIAVDPENVNQIVKATCVLHNMLQRQTTANQLQRLLEDAPDLDNAQKIRPLQGTASRSGLEVLSIRDSYKAFFIQDESVPWQNEYIRRGSF